MSTISTSLRGFVNRSLAPFGPPAAGQRFGGAAELIAAAERRAGMGDWGDPHFRGGLSALLAALEELPGLTPLGVVTFGSMIRQALVNRLRFVGDPSPRRDLDAPVIITGLPRSGTTALHRLLALDPVFHASPLWELLDPFCNPRPEISRTGTDGPFFEQPNAVNRTDGRRGQYRIEPPLGAARFMSRVSRRLCLPIARPWSGVSRNGSRPTS